MEKEKIIIISLSIISVILLIFAFMEFNRIVQLKSQNNNLEIDRAQLSKDKEELMAEREQLILDNKNLDSKTKMLEEDVNKIYKSCMTQNACKGKYPGIRWNCNNVGDLAETNPSHTCVCDSSCLLTTTKI